MIATTIEQSNKLLELGIDISTADMFWLVTREPHLHVLVLGNEPLSNYDSLEHYCRLKVQICYGQMIMMLLLYLTIWQQ